MPFPFLPVIASAVGTALGARAARKASQKNYEAQKEFAQQGLRWRVEEAKAAGISPLAALGFQGPHFSPSYTGQDYSDFGSGLQSMTTRGTQTLPERQMFAARLRQEQAKAKLIEFQSLALERKLNAPTQMSPPINEMGVVQFPPEAVSDTPAGVAAKVSGAVQYVPDRVPISSPQGYSAAQNPSYDQYVSPEGSLWYAPNEKLSEVLESYFPSRLRLYGSGLLRQGKFFMTQFHRFPGLVAEMEKQRPRVGIPPGHEARWDHRSFAWRLVKIGPEGSRLFFWPESLVESIRKRFRLQQTSDDGSYPLGNIVP